MRFQNINKECKKNENFCVCRQIRHSHFLDRATASITKKYYFFKYIVRLHSTTFLLYFVFNFKSFFYVYNYLEYHFARFSENETRKIAIANCKQLIELKIFKSPFCTIVISKSDNPITFSSNTFSTKENNSLKNYHRSSLILLLLIKSLFPGDKQQRSHKISKGCAFLYILFFMFNCYFISFLTSCFYKYLNPTYFYSFHLLYLRNYYLVAEDIASLCFKQHSIFSILQ